MHSPAASNYEYAAKAAKNRCFPLVEWAAGGQERVGTGGEIEEGEERKDGRDRECILCLARSQARRRTIWGHFTLICKDDKKLGVYIAAVESVFLGRARFSPNEGGKFKMQSVRSF